MYTRSSLMFYFILASGLLLIPGCGPTNRNRVSVRQPVIARTTEKNDSIPVSKEELKLHNQAQKALLRPLPKDLTLQQLRARLVIDRDNSYTEDTIKVIEQLIILSQDQEELQELRLELADIYFETGRMKEAGRTYREFVKLYPGSKNRDYAEYKNILCNFYTQLQPPRDQSRTEKTTVLTKKYLDQESVGQAFRDDVQKIQTTCYQDLFEHEKGIFMFYCKQYNLKAAHARLKRITQDFADMTFIKPSVIELEVYLAQLENNQELMAQKSHELETTFPAYQPLLLASAQRKPNYADRF